MKVQPSLSHEVDDTILVFGFEAYQDGIFILHHNLHKTGARSASVRETDFIEVFADNFYLIDALIVRTILVCAEKPNGVCGRAVAIFFVVGCSKAVKYGRGEVAGNAVEFAVIEDIVVVEVRDEVFNRLWTGLAHIVATDECKKCNDEYKSFHNC